MSSVSMKQATRAMTGDVAKLESRSLKLDHEEAAPIPPVTVGISYEDARELRILSTKEPLSYRGDLCAAWGLVLRSYTGQDEVSYQISEVERSSFGEGKSPSPDPVTWKGRFSDDDSLSACVELAKNACITAGSGDQLDKAIRSISDHSLDFTQTAVWFHTSRQSMKAPVPAGVSLTTPSLRRSRR